LSLDDALAAERFLPFPYVPKAARDTRPAMLWDFAERRQNRRADGMNEFSCKTGC
jgi:hypothetical protein